MEDRDAACVLMLLMHVLACVACCSSTRLLHSLTGAALGLLHPEVYRGCCWTTWAAGPTACALAQSVSQSVRAVAAMFTRIGLLCR